MAGPAEQDIARLLESRHDIDAASSPEVLSDEPRLQAAIELSREELAERRASLVVAVAHNSREATETDETRAALTGAVATATAHYGWLRRNVKQALTDPDPDQPVEPTSLENLKRIWLRVFPLNQGELERLGPDKAAAFIETTASAIDKEPAVRDLDMHERFVAKAAAVQALAPGHAREVAEDREATRALEEARAALDASPVAHSTQVESVLRRTSRHDTIGRYIKRRDPAYAARRETSSRSPRSPRPPSSPASSTRSSAARNSPGPHLGEQRFRPGKTPLTEVSTAPARDAPRSPR